MPGQILELEIDRDVKALRRRLDMDFVNVDLRSASSTKAVSFCICHSHSAAFQQSSADAHSGLDESETPRA